MADWAAGALHELGLMVEVVRPDLHEIRADPAWPGEEMSANVAAGRDRAGGPGQRQAC